MLRRLLVRLSFLLTLGTLFWPSPQTRRRPSPHRALPRRLTTASASPLMALFIRWAQARYDRGVVTPSMPMERMQLVLKLSASQDKALALAIKEMQRPGSKAFHHWLTLQQICTLYGVSQDDVAKISNWLLGSGFNVTRSPGRVA
jgi:Pro-kumamolisin, activation domain